MDAIFFPRKDYDVEVCNHRYGKAMTYTEQTDMMKSNTFPTVKALAQQYGIRIGAFVNGTQPTFDTISYQDMLPDIRSGLLWVDVYWRYGGETNQTEVNEATFNTENANQVNLFKAAFGRKPVAFSYGLGNYTYKDYVGNKYLAGRNSLYLSKTDYGKSFGGVYLGNEEVDYSLADFVYKASSTRFLDYAERSGIGYETSLQNQSDLIDATMFNGGWVMNFHHWHDFINHSHTDWLEGYFQLLWQKKSQYNDQIYFAGYGEAVAYMVYRSIITKAVMYSPLQYHSTQLIIRLETSNNLGVDAGLLQVPISIKFSTTGTPLAGQSIKCDGRNLISLGNNQYIIEIPYERFPYAVIGRV